MGVNGIICCRRGDVYREPWLFGLLRSTLGAYGCGMANAVSRREDGLFSV